MVFFNCVQKKEQPSARRLIPPPGDYLGQTKPDSNPEIFASGFVSTRYNERDITFSPDGNQVYFSLCNPNTQYSAIVYFEWKNDTWSKPKIASFSGQYRDLESFVTPDGEKLYFASNRPLENGGDPKDWDIWVVHKTNNGWSEAQNIGAPVNTKGDEFYPSVSKNESLYFTAERDGSRGGEDIYVSRLLNGEYQAPENLGDSINTSYGEFNAVIAPDGSFIVFSSFGRGDGIGGGDLYISYQKSDGNWSKAKILGEPINSSSLDYCPAFSPDGEYFFFTSRRVPHNFNYTQSNSYEQLIALLNNPENGLGNIYWVKSELLQLKAAN
jgi:Tol biopolymer transport system component